MSWLVSVRQDLAEDYEALEQPEKAAEFRAQLTKTTEKIADQASKN